jgi:GDSL-like lipase/acylhydrolase family protein
MSASGNRTCLLEEFAAGAESCSENKATGAYRETFYATPRTGWQFDHWVNCLQATANACTFDIDAETVQGNWFETMPALRAVFLPTEPAESAPAPFQVTYNNSQGAGSILGSSAATVLVAGDSLTAIWSGVGARTMAESIRDATWMNAWVASSGGSSIPNWLFEGWLWGVPGGDINPLQQLVDYLQPTITVIALGSNDARIIAAGMSAPNGYTAEVHRADLITAVEVAQSSSQCVLITNVADNWDAPNFEAAVAAVNANIESVIEEKDRPGEKRVILLDWVGHEQGHPEYYAEDGLHHSDAGKEAYRTAITDSVRWLQLSGACGAMND